MTTTTISILGLRWESSSDEPSKYPEWVLFALAAALLIAAMVSS